MSENPETRAVERIVTALSEPSAEIAANGPRPARDALGRFALGVPNADGVVTADRAPVLRASLREQFGDVMREQEAAIVTERGGPENVSVLLKDRISDYVELTAIDAWMLDRVLAQGGPMTARGRSRALFTAWLGVRDRRLKLAQVIGLDRVPKPAPSLAEYLASRPVEAEPDADALEPAGDVTTDEPPEDMGETPIAVPEPDEPGYVAALERDAEWEPEG